MVTPLVLRPLLTKPSMVRQLKLEGFRGFERMTLDGFEQVNLIVGRNNVGKTAVLEALFLLAGPTNPELPLRLSALRGVESFRTDADEIWGWLFYRKRSEQDIDLVATLLSGKQRALNIRLVAPKGMKLAGKRKKNPTYKPLLSASAVESRRELQLIFRDEHGSNYKATATLKDTDLEYKRHQPIQMPNSVYVTGRSAYASENAQRFSKLEEDGREGELIGPMREIEPRLKRLAVLVNGSGPVIHADIGIGKMIPIHFMGEGIARVLTILLAMQESANGTILLDELETGLHYSAMLHTWRAISAMAKQNNVQVFATTHNWECLKAADEVFRSPDAPSLTVHRLDREQDHVRAVRLDAEMMELAIASGLEVR